MKLFFTRIAALISLFFCLSKPSLFAQANYEFKGATLISGTALSVGAVYKFSNVKLGTDANVTIIAITGGISITNIDGGGGFDRALQPVISVPGQKNGYIELQIDFFVAGTSTPETQLEVPISPIDVDGQMYSGLPLYEFDEVAQPNGFTYFQYAGSELNMYDNGTWVMGKNKTAVDYPGIDTAQKTVMFTTVNANISSISLRVGADNQSNTNTSRLRSIYFQRFAYPHHEVLSMNTLVNFSGQRKFNGIELKGVLTNNSKYDKVIIERGNNSSSFTPIGQMEIDRGNSPIAFFDGNPGSTVNYYRLRLINTQTGEKELSNILMIKADGKYTGAEIMTSFLLSANPVLTVRSQEEGEANLRVFDMSGRIIINTKVRLSAGANSFNLPSLNTVKGYLVVALETKNNQRVSRKVLVQ